MSERRKFRLRVEIEFYEPVESKGKVPDQLACERADLKEFGVEKYIDNVRVDVINETATIEEVIGDALGDK